MSGPRRDTDVYFVIVGIDSREIMRSHRRDQLVGLSQVCSSVIVSLTNSQSILQVTVPGQTDSTGYL